MKEHLQKYSFFSSGNTGGRSFFPFLMIVFLFTVIAAHGQQNNPVSVFTNIQPPYSPYFSDYFSPASTKWDTKIIFNDYAEPEWDVKLRITVESNKVRIQTRQDYIPPVPIHVFPGVPYSVTGADLAPYFQANNLTVQGISASDLNRNGRFPEGFYNFCIEVLDYRTGTVLSQKSCSSFWIQLNDEPITITPICGSVVRPNPAQMIPFQWHQSNAVSPNSMGTEYQLTVYEVTDASINPLYALQNNRALKIFQSAFINQNSFIYDMTAPVLDIGKKYVYTIQARDIGGDNEFKNKGISQPCWFWYGYPAGGTIALQQPLPWGSFGVNDAAYFKWSSPDNTIPGQIFDYHFKIVKLDSLQNPEDAIVNNPVWYEEKTISTSKLTPFELVVNRKLEPRTNYAWQVSAYTDGQLIAQSAVSAFYGPPLIDKFMAGMHEVKVKTTFNGDLNHLSGIALVQLSEEGRTQEVPFADLQLLEVGGRYVLNRGVIAAGLSDTSLIRLSPKVEDNLYAYFHPQKFRLDKQALEIYGHASWAFPHAVTSDKQAYVLSEYGWINFDKFRLSGHAVLNSGNRFSLLDPYRFGLNLFTSSDLLIDDNFYHLRLDGELVLPGSVKGTSIMAGNVKIPFSQAGQLFYITASKAVLANNILPLPNSNIVMAPASYIIDLSEAESPSSLSDNAGWKGVYFPAFRMDFNTDADLLEQLKFPRTIPVNYELSADEHFKNWIDKDGLHLSVSRKFAAGDEATFNTFPAKLDVLTLNIEKNDVQNSSLTGSIIIPFVSTETAFSFTCPISNTGFDPGYMDNMEGFKFVFNKDGEEQLVNITIQRAVFANLQRLDMTLDVEWPSLDVSLHALTGFKAWGNYKIGFLLPNGTMTLSSQAQGAIGQGETRFPVTFDGIGAGSSNGAYAFGLTGKAVLAEDVSGAEGPPAVNIYSTVPNQLLPKEAYVPGHDTETAVTSIPESPGENSYEDNLKVVENDMVNRLRQSGARATGTTASESGSLSVEAPDGNYSADGIVEKREESSRDSSWSHVTISFNQEAFLDELLTAVTVTLAQPFTDKITAAVDSQVVKITARIDRFRDTLNRKIDVQIHKLVDSLASRIAARLKKDDFDPTEQVHTIADSIADKLAADVNGNITRAVDNNVTYPLRSFFSNEISGRTNLFIQAQVKGILLDLLNGKVSFQSIAGDIADNLPVLLHGIGNDAFGMISMNKLEGTLASIGRDAAGGIRVSDIDNLLIRAVSAEASYIVSKALSGKVSGAVNNLANKILGSEGGETASAGLGLKMNFEGLGRNLKEGRPDKIVKLDAVSVALNTKFVSFGGLIHYTADDPVYGDTWQGTVMLNVKLPKKFSLQGAYVNGRKGDMPYWFCQISGVDDNNKPGQPMDKSPKKLSNPVNLGPVELVAASGRLYHHMTDIEGRPIVPDPNTNYGAGVNFVFFDASSHGRAMRIGAGANVEIKEDGNYIVDFNGELQMVLRNPTPEKPDATACGGGGVSLNYNSAESHFLGKGWVLFQKGFCAKGNFMVDVKPGYWAVQVGTRNDMIMITPGCMGWGAAGWAGINQTTANLGLGLSYSMHTRIGLDVGPVGGGINIDAGVAAGVEATVRYKPDVKLLQAGIWVDLWANVGIDWHTAIKSGYINLVSINCQGDLLMTFDPPPTTLAGTVHGHVQVLCFGVDFDAGFEKTL